MANWSNPLITTQYDVFVAEAKDRDVDAVTMFLNPGTNIPVGSIRYNRTTKIFEEWSGSAWVPIVLGVTGGGTGANSGSGAGASLGLGSMAYQNSNAVNITGGVVQYVTDLRPACSYIPNVNNTYDIGQSYSYIRNGYFGTGLIIPFGADKYIVG
jgi:hypothetical protein